jgi:SpoVK/Ycf46/Vps4 family AAA+-type ATPase
MIFLLDLPNLQERLDIFNCHLNEPRQNGLLASNISTADLRQLADATIKYSGADIAELVRLAVSRAVSRVFIVSAADYSSFLNIVIVFQDTTTDLDKLNPAEQTNICVEWNDLVNAFYQCQKTREMRENEFKTKEDNI